MPRALGRHSELLLPRDCLKIQAFELLDSTRAYSLGLGSEILKRARLVLMFLRLELNSRAKFNPAGASVRTEGVLVGSKKAIPAWSLTATAQKLTIGYADRVGLN